MKLKDFLQVANDQTIAIWEGMGGTSIGHIFTKNLTSGPIPKELLEREVHSISANPIEQYGRPSAMFTVTLK